MNESIRHSVLVVDDDPAIVIGLRKRLQAGGFEVCAALTAADAMDLARSGVADVMTLDVGLPGEINGLRLAAILKEDERTRNIPVVFITGTADDEFKRQCQAAGGVCFLAKPYDPDVLIRVLKGIFGNDELAQAARLSSAKRRQPQGVGLTFVTAARP